MPLDINNLKQAYVYLNRDVNPDLYQRTVVAQQAGYKASKTRASRLSNKLSFRRHDWQTISVLDAKGFELDVISFVVNEGYSSRNFGKLNSLDEVEKEYRKLYDLKNKA